jgi:mono/diheme cytochrome c family protein
MTALALVSIALSAACGSIEPEVGERLTACVDADSNPAVTVSFKDQIRPIMAGKVPGPPACGTCHSPQAGTMEGFIATGLDLRTLGGLRKGGRNTFDDIVVPGHPCQSAVVQKLKGTYGGARMPKGGPYWTAEQLQLMIDWIAEGANGADDE